MKKIVSVATSVAILAGAFAFALPAVASADVVYNAVPSTLAGNYPSQPFQAQQTREFGDYVHLAGTARNLTTITLTMSDWALASTLANATFCAASESNCDSTGFFWPITVNIYANSLTNDVPDTLLATKEVRVHIPWRPEGPLCPSDPTGWLSGADCFHGFAANVTFDLSDLHFVLPNDVIVGFVYNTQTYGPHPTGVDGPYNSLNIAVPPTDVVTVGTDDSADQVFWNTSTVGYYTNHTCAGNTFCRDTNWTPNGTVAMQINAVTPPAGRSNGVAKATGTINMSGPAQQISFSAFDSVHSGQPAKGWVTYYNYEYPVGSGYLSYTAPVLCANVSGADATFTFQIPAGFPGLSGLYVAAKVHDGGKPSAKGDTYGHAATGNLAEATSWCVNANAPVGYYPIVGGNLVVH